MNFRGKKYYYLKISKMYGVCNFLTDARVRVLDVSVGRRKKANKNEN